MDAGSEKSGFFYLKWEEHFFDDHKLKCLEGRGEPVSCTIGDYAILLYVRLVNESISHGGRLRYSRQQPYTTDILSSLFGMEENSLEKAKDLLCQRELIEIEEDGTIVIPHVFNKIKTETAAAAAMRRLRQKAKSSQHSTAETKPKQQSSRRVKRSDNIVKQSDNNVTYSIQSTVNSLQSTDINTPHNPPQGGEEVDLFSYQNDSSGGDDQWESVNPNTNGSSGFAQQRNEPASQITREELAEWVKNEAPKTTMTITKADEDAFWNWLVAARFKNGKGRLITKWNVGKTIFYFIENRKKDSGKPKSVSATARDIMWQTTHLQQEGYEVRD